MLKFDNCQISSSVIDPWFTDQRWKSSWGPWTICEDCLWSARNICSSHSSGWTTSGSMWWIFDLSPKQLSISSRCRLFLESSNRHYFPTTCALTCLNFYQQWSRASSTWTPSTRHSCSGCEYSSVLSFRMCCRMACESHLLHYHHPFYPRTIVFWSFFFCQRMDYCESSASRCASCWLVCFHFHRSHLDYQVARWWSCPWCQEFWWIFGKVTGLHPVLFFWGFQWCQ